VCTRTPREKQKSIQSHLAQTFPIDFTLSIKNNAHLTPQKHSMLKQNHSNVGILMQGPFVYYRDFTLQTARLYREMFPTCEIVISTWADSSIQNYQRELEKIQVRVIINEVLKSVTLNNEDLQAVTTSTGLSQLKNTGVDWVLKSRCDMRIGNPKSLNRLLSLSQIFPLPYSSSHQESRLIGVDKNTKLFIPYSLSDTLLFGKINDITDYFSLLTRQDYETLAKNSLKKNEIKTLDEFARLVTGEHFFCFRFLEKRMEKMDFLINSWWDIMGKRFGIINSSELSLYWIKSQLREDWFSWFPSNFSEESLSQTDWISMTNKSMWIPPDVEKKILTSSLQ